MSKKTLFGLAFVMLLTLVTVPLSSAKEVEYRANGKVLSYPDQGPNPSAVVVGGNWNIKIKGENVVFELFYREMNLIEQEGSAPAGSVDHFYMSLVETWYVDVWGDGECFVMGLFKVDKLAWRPEGSTPPIDHVYDYWGWRGLVYINPEGIWLSVGLWNLIGSTTTVHQ